MLRSVKELRQQGYKVGVQHNRYYDNAEICGNNPEGIIPNGGETTVRVTTPDGRTVVGVSTCAAVDNFNKKRGVQIALGRALKELNSPQGRQLLISFNSDIQDVLFTSSSVMDEVLQPNLVGNEESRDL